MAICRPPARQRNRAATPDTPRSKNHGPNLGHALIHTVIDDHSRIAYAEIHNDETAATATGVLLRAVAWFTALGITVERVLSDNGPAYRSRLWPKNAMHDFYIEGDGHKVALEVTTIADGRRVGRDHRWEREAPGGSIKVEGLSGCWIAYHEGDIEASDVVRAIQAHLPQLEALGVLKVDARSWQQHIFTPESLRPVDYEHLRALNVVGIVQADCITEAPAALLDEHGGEVQVARGFGISRPADHNFPVEVINEQLPAPGLHRSDVKKLLAVDDATARHLWMWVEPNEGLAMMRSFETEGPPDLDLEVEGIEGVWLGRNPAKNVVAGYLWLRGFGWSEFSAAQNV